MKLTASKMAAEQFVHGANSQNHFSFTNFFIGQKNNEKEGEN
jgi:hypothetical protein